MKLINSNKKLENIVLLCMRSFVSRSPCAIHTTRTKCTVCWEGKSGSKMWIELCCPYPEHWSVYISLDIEISKIRVVFPANSVLPYLKDAIKFFIDTYNFEF